MKSLCKAIARALLGDYAPYRIYAFPADPAAAPDGSRRSQGDDFGFRAVDAGAIEASPDALIREQAGYAGDGARSYACFDGERIVGVCFYWSGSRYLKRNFWPLRQKEGKLVQIIVLPEARGRGIAGALITRSAGDMMESGFRRVYARIWHSNTPSLHAFERAGWKRIAFVLEVDPLRRGRPMRLRWHTG